MNVDFPMFFYFIGYFYTNLGLRVLEIFPYTKSFYSKKDLKCIVHLCIFRKFNFLIFVNFTR